MSVIAHWVPCLVTAMILAAPAGMHSTVCMRATSQVMMQVQQMD
jgi:hypothetical protein